ncbi:MAG: hypothetical protein KAQ69_05680 [Spirochaetales bacterium]|nr:hypothetical protein [Spirochaetales bacterium]
MKFRILTNTEIDIAYDIVKQRFTYLEAKGINQYPFPFPARVNYIENHYQKENYGYFNNLQLLGIVTLSKRNKLSDWDSKDSNTTFLWVSALYTNPIYKNNNFGYEILCEVQKVAIANNIQTLLLDCYKDGNFLENYYSDYGFSKVSEKMFKYPGRQFTACLMKLDIEGYGKR